MLEAVIGAKPNPSRVSLSRDCLLLSWTQGHASPVALGDGHHALLKGLWLHHQSCSFLLSLKRILVKLFCLLSFQGPNLFVILSSLQ